MVLSLWMLLNREFSFGRNLDPQSTYWEILVMPNFKYWIRKPLTSSLTPSFRRVVHLCKGNYSSGRLAGTTFIKRLSQLYNALLSTLQWTLQCIFNEWHIHCPRHSQRQNVYIKFFIIFILGNTSLRKKIFLSGIARMRGGRTLPE